MKHEVSLRIVAWCEDCQKDIYPNCSYAPEVLFTSVDVLQRELVNAEEEHIHAIENAYV